MKIAVNARFLLPDKLEGLGWYTYEVVQRLIKIAPADQFFLIHDRRVPPFFPEQSNVTHISIPPPARHPFLWWMWFEHSLPRVLKQIDADIFFSPDGYCSLKTGTPTVMVTHDIAHVHYPQQIPWLVRKYYEYYVPKYISRADHVITVSKFTKQDIIATYNTPSTKITPIYNGCRSNFKPIPEREQLQVRQEYAEGLPYFFYLGALHPRKNIKRLLMAFDQFKQASGAEVKLLIAGRLAWQYEDIKHTYEKLRFKRDIKLLGYVSESILPKLLGSAHGLLYPSLFEGFGLPIIEAFFCEIPVLTANTSAMKEVAQNAAIIVDPFSEKSIQDGIHQLWSNPPLRQSLITKGNAHRKNFDWDQTAKQIYQILNNASAQKKFSGS